MVDCVINVAAAGGSRKVQSEGGEICKAYFASFFFFLINIFLPISISTFSLFLVIQECCLRSQIIYVDYCACVAARWATPASTDTLARKHKIIRSKPICPLQYLENGIQKYKLELADCLKWIHHNKDNSHNSTQSSKTMLQGNVIMNWIEMYVAIDEFKSYLPHQPQLM